MGILGINLPWFGGGNQATTSQPAQLSRDVPTGRTVDTIGALTRPVGSSLVRNTAAFLSSQRLGFANLATIQESLASLTEQASRLGPQATAIAQSLQAQVSQKQQLLQTQRQNYEAQGKQQRELLFGATKHNASLPTTSSLA